MRETLFFRQADLLVRVMPFVNAEACFALKGGTAINFFVRDFPRLSVDIDLVYLPLEDRSTTLRGIDAALQRIAAKIRRAMPSLQAREHRTISDKLLDKLTVRAADGAEVKIEPNTVLRGALHPTAELNLSRKAVELFGRSATMRVMSLPDLFGGKLCAALDRQHPRDLFDVHGLFQAEGITDDIRRAFVVFLASHDRPMNELLTPNRKDLKQVFADQFDGMTLDPVPLAVLEDTRERLIERINADLTAAEREFLLSMKRLKPKWELLGLPGVERLPGPQWKLYNLRKMDAAKRRAAEDRLRQKLGM
ncbi:MAG TPA: nucleotidyl transferase AbiEii/AbiGii toxin family protein [Opitutaceae bacterium]|nr:nucleotidyl transferase AbiEii/AbiGii toxin family protein [Opitutaceae bacterium]